MHTLQAVVVEPFKTGVREGDLPPPAPNQILVAAEVSAIRPAPNSLFTPARTSGSRTPTCRTGSSPSNPATARAGTVVAVGSDVQGWQPGDRVSYPGNHASLELLTIGHERGRLWKMPPGLDAEKAAWACIARYGLGASIRAGITLGRSATVLGLGVIGQFALRCLIAAGASPVIGIDSVPMRREAALAAGAAHVIDPSSGDAREQQSRFLGGRGAEIVADATGVPDAFPVAMSLACDGGQVVVVGSPRGKAKDVNFYDDLHRRYLEVTVRTATCCSSRPIRAWPGRGTSTRPSTGCWQ